MSAAHPTFSAYIGSQLASEPSAPPIVHASRLLELDDGHEFGADFEQHRSVGACMTIFDGFGNSVEINGLENIQALIRAGQAAELRASSFASIRKAA